MAKLPDESSTFDVQAAATAAAAAAPYTAAAPVATRAAWLRAVADALDEEAEPLASSADRETSLGVARLTGEVGRTTGQLRLFADVIDEGSYLEVVIDHADLETTPPRPDLRRMLLPLGPVAVFAASNFPFAFSVAGGDTASALAAGCPVVVKAHPGHPETSRSTAEVVAKALDAAGAPDGTFGLVEGFEAGTHLVADPRIKAVGFTGSLAGGRALFDLASSRPDPIPFYGELGSLNPVVLTRGAVAARGAELATGLAESVTLGVGQFCTKPGIVFVPAGAGFESALAEVVGQAQPAAMLHEGIAERFASALGSVTSDARVEIVAGDPVAAVSGRDATPVVLTTSVEALLGATDRLLEECFGPSVLLVRYHDQAELLAGLNAFQGSLTAAVYAQPEEHVELAAILEAMYRFAGRVIHGGWPTGVAVTWAQQHGGPWPSTTAPLHTSVGATALRRFLRPVAFQDVPDTLLPDALRDTNPLSIPRRVNGRVELP